MKLELRDEAYSTEMGEDRFAYLWVWDVREYPDGICGRVIELPKEGINDLVKGADVRFSRDAVCDWMVYEGSQAWGGFTVRAIRSKMSARESLEHDGYTGILAYRDLPFTKTVG